MTHPERFLDLYRLNIISLLTTQEESLELTTSSNTVNQLARGHARTLTPTIRKTCRDLGIPITHRSIQRFLNQ